MLKFYQTGACIVYTPEDGIDLDMLRRDVNFMKKRYGIDKRGKAEGRLIIRCDQCVVLNHGPFVRKGGTMTDSYWAGMRFPLLFTQLK